MYSFVIKIAKLVNKALLDVITTPQLRINNTNVLDLMVEADPINISVFI